MCRVKTTKELRSFLLLYLSSIKDEGRSQWNRDRRAKKYRGGLPKEIGAPETGMRRNCDLLTPQGKDLSPWYLKTG